MDIKEMTTEELRQLKKDISDELSRRHKAKEDEKCSCWICEHCSYDENAHPSYKNPDFRGGYRCLAWGDKGRNISTKHKAPAWCPLGERPYYYYGKRKGVEDDKRNNLL